MLSLTESLMSHKWENALSLDKQSWGFRNDMNAAEVMSFEELLNTVVTTVSCGGKIK